MTVICKLMAKAEERKIERLSDDTCFWAKVGNKINCILTMPKAHRGIQHWPKTDQNFR